MVQVQISPKFLQKKNNFCDFQFVVVVILLLYTYGHVGMVSNLTILFLARLRPPKQLTSTKSTYFCQ